MKAVDPGQLWAHLQTVLHVGVNRTTLFLEGRRGLRRRTVLRRRVLWLLRPRRSFGLGGVLGLFFCRLS